MSLSNSASSSTSASNLPHLHASSGLSPCVDEIAVPTSPLGLTTEHMVVEESKLDMMPRVDRARSVVRGSDSCHHEQDLSWFNTRNLLAKSRYNNLAQLASIDVMRDVPHGSVMSVRKTSIVCTIGPKTSSVEAIVGLRKAGMNILRLNFSHGDYAWFEMVLENLQKSYDLYPGHPIAVALDTKGPEIRTGNMHDGRDVKLHKGDIVTITTNEEQRNQCSNTLIFVDYVNISKVLTTGKLVYIDDGLIKLEVVSVDEDNGTLSCRVCNDGTLSSRKGVNLPTTPVDLPNVSEKDKRDLAWGVKHQIDFVFASFIRSADAIKEIRDLLGPEGARIQIISKIENQQGIDSFNEILLETDGVMVARGDLGIEIPVEKVFLAQKMISARCNILGKPVICATQMLESMTTNPRPTRAEVSDVANAVLDGADCVMLSGETAKGDYPYAAVETMHVICKEAESAVSNSQHYRAISDIHPEMFQTSETLAGSAVNAAFSRNLNAIIVFSMSGRTARLVAKYRPSCPIVCVTTDPVTARHASISRGVYPVLVKEKFDGTESWLEYIERQLEAAVHECKYGNIKILQKGDLCVVVQGWAGGSGHSNTMRLVVV